MSGYIFPAATFAAILGGIWWLLGPEFLLAVAIIVGFTFWIARALHRIERDGGGWE